MSEVLINQVVESEEVVEDTEVEVVTKRGRKAKEAVVPKAEGDMQNVLDMFLTSVDKNILTEDDNKLMIPTGIDILDAVLGGGICMKFNLVFGPPGGGKSSILCKTISNAQRIWGDKFISLYLDSEESMTKERLMQLGVNNPPIVPIIGITIEKVFKIIDQICAFKEKNKDTIAIPTIVAWDSYASTLTESMVDSDERNNMMAAQKAAIMAFYLPKYITKMNKYNICLFTANQIRDDLKTDKYDSTPTAMNFVKSGTVPGGKAVAHLNTQAIELYQFGSKDEIEKTLGFKGIKVRLNCVRNKYFSPNIPIELIFSFANGYSNFWSNAMMLKEFKYIETSGAWTVLKSHPVKKFYMKELIKLCSEDDDFKNAFKKDVKECIQKNYVDKYMVTTQTDLDLN